MSDVFISYARSTADKADRMTQALRSLGYQVWRDDQLPAHLTYGEVIEERLHEAKAVVVIWSADALQSVWVRSEADRARALKKLVQATVDGSRLPMPFDQIQCADLADWTGEIDHKGFRKVAESLEHLVPERAPPAATQSAAAAVVAEPQPVGSEAGDAASPPVAAAPPPATKPSASPGQDADLPAALEPPPAPSASSAREDATPLPAAEPARAVVRREVRAAALDAREAPLAVRPRAGAALMGLGATAAAIVVGGVVWLAAGRLPHHGGAPAPTEGDSGKPTLALMLAPTPIGVDDKQISLAAAGLPNEARAAGRPAAEADALVRMSTQIDGLLTQLKSASGRSGGAGSAAALTNQLNQTAAKGVQAEASILSRAGDAMVSDAQNTLRGEGAPSGAAPALAALRNSVRNLHAAAAGPVAAGDAAGSLAALHAALAAWRQVRTDYATATALYPTVLRARFQTAAEAARAAAQHVIAAAQGPKPWLFASSSQKRAYTVAQANAASAKADLSQLEALSQSVASSDRESQLRAAIRQAGDIRASLGALAVSAKAPSSGG